MVCTPTKEYIENKKKNYNLVVRNEIIHQCISSDLTDNREYALNDCTLQNLLAPTKDSITPQHLMNLISDTYLFLK
jgi:hypothetical protein